MIDGDRRSYVRRPVAGAGTALAGWSSSDSPDAGEPRERSLDNYCFDTGSTGRCLSPFCLTCSPAVTPDPLSGETERWFTVGPNSGVAGNGPHRSNRTRTVSPSRPRSRRRTGWEQQSERLTLSHQHRTQLSGFRDHSATVIGGDALDTERETLGTVLETAGDPSNGTEGGS